MLGQIIPFIAEELALTCSGEPRLVRRGEGITVSNSKHEPNTRQVQLGNCYVVIMYVLPES